MNARGYSARRIAIALEISNNTAARYVRTSPVVSLCACGKSSGHRGWCGPRFRASPARQKMFAEKLSPSRKESA